jgi:inosose dehydratase
MKQKSQTQRFDFTRSAHWDDRFSKGASRREFMKRLALGLAPLALAAPGVGAPGGESNLPNKTLVGSNSYGWGQYAQRENKKLDLDEVISALRDCGYDYLETFLNLNDPENGPRFATQLRAKGLRPVSMYVSGPLHEADKASDTVKKMIAAAKICKSAGFEVFSCNPDPIGREKTDKELKTQVAALSEIGKGMKELGMRLAIHQHLPEMANHGREFHFDFDHTRPDEVGWCYDVHWVWKGGIQPLEALRQYGDRVATWHLRQSRDGIWWEDLDTGDIDYSAVAKYARQHDLPRRFSVELALEPGTKITRSVVENHRRSREFVRRVFENVH